MSAYFLLPLAALISAAVHIRAEYRGPRRRVYIFKPLTLLLIITMAWMISSDSDPFYRQMILLGLVFSMLGDIFLMLPRDRFIFGLVSFLIGHCFYIAAFMHYKELAETPFILLPFLLYAAIFLYRLLPETGSLKIPVLIYAAALAAMGWQAADRWFSLHSAWTMAAAIGSVFFIVSDSALAWNRFIKKFPQAQALILSTYYTAQILIALSLYSL